MNFTEKKGLDRQVGPALIFLSYLALNVYNAKT